MTKYKKKPVVVEAFKFYVDAMPDWFISKVNVNDVILYSSGYPSFNIDEAYCEIKTSSGTITANGGDFIVIDAQGEISSYTPYIFDLNYERHLVWDENL